jgi:hypothetical protein
MPLTKKEGNMKFRIILLCIFLSVIIPSSICAQKVYYWKDEKGVMNATTTPPPDNVKEYQSDSFGKKSTPAEIEQYNREQKAAEAHRESIRRFNRNQEEARQERESERRTVQDARDRRADQLKAVVGAVTSDMPSSQRRGFEEAARLKSEQIKAGTDTPISPSEDARFHVEQEVRWQLEKDRILRPKK